jgi:hypothetical protein
MGRNGKRLLKRKLLLLWYVPKLARVCGRIGQETKWEEGGKGRKADEQEEPEPPKFKSKPESKSKAKPESKAVTKPESKPKAKPESEIKDKGTDQKVRPP